MIYMAGIVILAPYKGMRADRSKITLEVGRKNRGSALLHSSFRADSETENLVCVLQMSFGTEVV